MYQVVKDGQIVDEFTDVQSARAKAIEVTGRIQITTKTVEV